MAKYWLSVLAAAFVAALVAWGKFGGHPLTGFIVLAFVFPGVQLAASLVACIGIACSSLPDKKAMFKKVGIITLWTIIGAAGGVGVMFLFYVAAQR